MVTVAVTVIVRVTVAVTVDSDVDSDGDGDEDCSFFLWTMRCVRAALNPNRAHSHHLEGSAPPPIPTIKAKASCRRHPKSKNNKTYAKANHQTLFIFEVFKPNILQIRIQRIFLHRVGLVEIHF